METIDKRYTILWIDDQCKELIDFDIQAESNGINLIGFTSFEEGFKNLDDDLDRYDGVLLDAMFFENKDQVKGTEDEVGLGMAISRLNELKSKKYLPWFVLSGKESFTKNNNSILKANKKRCFDKTNGGDLEELFRAIKEEADIQEDTQIRHQYAKAFEASESLGSSAQKTILQILKGIKNPTAVFEDKLYFTQLRIVLESFFRVANNQGFLHDKCLEGGKVNLSDSSLFSAGRETSYSKVKCSKAHFPKIIADNVWAIIAITGSASHTEAEGQASGKASISEYRKYVNSPYLLYSLTFQLIDVLIWFKNYSAENPDKEANKALWAPIKAPIVIERWVEGDIVSIEDDKSGTFLPLGKVETLSINPVKMTEHNLRERQRIHVTTRFDISTKKSVIEKIKV